MRDPYPEQRPRWIDKILRKERPCPNCKHGRIEINTEFGEQGGRCVTCQKDYEIDLKWFLIIWGSLMLIMFAPYQLNGFPKTISLIAAICGVMLYIFDKQIVLAWFPLKHVKT